MTFRLIASTTALCCCAMSMAAHAEIYHVDANRGNDRHNGHSAHKAWRSLTRVNAAELNPGDTVLLAAGSVWHEPLVIARSGRDGEPITIGMEGEGPRPRIDGDGVTAAVTIRNAEYVSISGLEITNRPIEGGPPEAATTLHSGVLVDEADFGVARGISLTDLYIHDVIGTNRRKDNGGIVFSATASRLPTRFEGLTVARNIIWHVDRSGIAGISDQVDRAKWFPSRHIVIRDNYLEDIGGDGIVPRGADGALIEHNIVIGAAARSGEYSAGIWQWSTDNTLIQLNEASFTHGIKDGQGFDSDFNSRGTTLLYNYSHDNDGGFVLICTPVNRDDATNLGNSGSHIRGNVSRNDHSRIFQLAGAFGARVTGNVIHVGAEQDVQMVIATNWNGWSNDFTFDGNLFAVAGTARYGHEVARNGAAYLIGPGFAPATAIRFAGNAYRGRQIDAPADPTGQIQADYIAPEADWDVPRFDPAHPEGFGEFLERHRNWMLAMLSRELGKPPQLERPTEPPTLPQR